MVLFTSDLHLGHRNIFKYRNIFTSMKQHDDYMIDRILELGKRDVLFILGDFMFDGPHFDDYVERLSKKKCRIKLIMGNHDSLLLYKNLNLHLEVQLPFFSYKNHWLSHSPIHPYEMRNRIGNIHGHMHLERLEDSKYFNVNIDVNNYTFVDFDYIKEEFKKVII